MAYLKSHEGQSLLEVLLALGIIVVIMGAVFPLLGREVLGLVDSQDRLEAMYLAREGVQASRAIHSRSFYDLEDGVHGLSLSDGAWSLQGSSDQVGKFTRSLTITSPDLVTRDITSQILWTDTSGFASTVNFSFSALFTDWYQINIWGNWVNEILLGQADIGPTAEGNGIDSNGTYAYIAASAATDKPKLYSFLVSNPAAPTLSQSLDTGDSLNDLIIYDNYVVTAGTQDAHQMRVFDASTPNNLSEVAYLSLNQEAKQIYRSGNKLAIAGTNFLSMVGMLNPLSPVLESSVALGGSGNDIDGLDSNVFIATSSDSTEVQIFSIGGLGNPQQIGTIDIPGSEDALSMSLQDNFLVVGTRVKSADSEVRIYNIQNPSSPVFVNKIETGANVTALRFAIPYLFIGTDDSNEELKIYDARQPSSPVKISGNNLSQLVRDMTLVNNTLYLTLRSQDSLKILGPSL